MIRIGVAAPALATRLGLRALLAADEALVVVDEFSSWSEQPGTLATAVDVIVLAGDPQSWINVNRAGSGEEPPPAILLLSDDTQNAAALQAHPNLVWGWLPLDTSADELTAAVRAVYQGLWVIAPAFRRAVLAESASPARLSADSELVESLTARESQVLQGLAQGLANKQIAHQLGISENTVKYHISSIYAKLGAANRTEAVRLGIQYGLLSL